LALKKKGRGRELTDFLSISISISNPFSMELLIERLDKNFLSSKLGIFTL
jgi:hypothetical protein